MFKKISLILIILTAITTGSGCWDAQDIAERSVVVLAAVDLNQEGGIQFGKPVQYDATILMPNLYTDTAEKVRIARVSGVSLSGSRDQRAYINPQTILTSMIRVYLFGESMSISGLAPVLDSLLRNPLLSNSVYMATTEGQAGDMITVQPPDFPDLGIYIIDLLRKVNDKSFFPVITLHDFRVQSASPGKNPVLPILRVDAGEVKISGLGIFRKDKLIDRVGLDGARPLTLLRGVKCKGYIPFVITREGEEVDRGTVFVGNGRKVRVERQGDQYTFNITITLKGQLIEHENPVILTRNREFLSMIEAQVAADIESECQTLIETMQEEYRVDCIDISKYALAKWRSELEDTIDEGFIERANINVDVKVHIGNTGDLI